MSSLSLSPPTPREWVAAVVVVAAVAVPFFGLVVVVVDVAVADGCCGALVGAGSISGSSGSTYSFGVLRKNSSGGRMVDRRVMKG